MIRKIAHCERRGSQPGGVHAARSTGGAIGAASGAAVGAVAHAAISKAR